MKRRLLAFLLAFVMTFSLVPVNTFAAEADAAAHYTKITTESGENVTVEYVETVVGVAAWGQSINTPYYHVTIPEGTKKVLLTYPESVNLVLSGDDGAVFFYRNTYPGQSTIDLGGALTVATNDDGSKTVTIPVENFMLSTDGSVAVGMAYYVDGENQSAAEFFDFTYAALTHAVTLTSGEGYTLTGEATVEDGKDYSFTVTIADDYEMEDNFVVKANGETLTAGESGSYTVENVTADLTITVEGVVKKQAAPHSVTLTSGGGYTLKGETTVADGADYTFSLKFDNYYGAGNGFAVKANGTALTAGEDGTYTVKNVTTDLTITVEGVARLYKVSLPHGWSRLFTMSACDGYADPSTDPKIAKGGDYKFKVTPNEGFAVQDNNYDVSFSGSGDVSVEVKDGCAVVTLTNIYSNGSVNIQGVKEIITVTLPKSEGFTAAAAEGTKTPVLKGDSYSFTVTVAEGYKKTDDFAVKANGKALTANEDGSYTVADINANVEITVEGVGKQAAGHAVTLTPGEGYTLTGEATVENGKDYSFTVTVAEGYEKTDDFAVKANDETLTAGESGSYTVKNVSTDLTITVEGVVKKQAAPHSVTLTSGGGYTLKGETTVADGADYTFSLKFDNYYGAGNGFAVKANGTALTAGEDGTYTVKNVTTDLTITVEGVARLYKVSLPHGWSRLFTMSACDGYADPSTDPKIAKGGDYKFKVTPNEGFAVQDNNYDVSFSGAGTVSVEVKDGYAVVTLTDIFSNGDVRIQGVKEIITVTLPNGEGFTAAAAEGTKTPVLKGDSYSFTVAANEGYDATNMVVKVNGNEVAGTDGSYTVENVSSDLTITVEGVTEAVQETAGLSVLKFGDTSTEAKAQMFQLIPAFDPAVKEYTVLVPDNSNMFYAWATKADDRSSSTTITAKWVNLNIDTEKTQALTSGKASGQNLAGFAPTGTKVNTMTVTVVDGDFKDEYKLTSVRVAPSLTALSLDGIRFAESFSATKTAYTATTAAESVTVAATPRDESYTVTVNGGSDTTVPLNLGENKIDVVVTNPGGYTNTYTITVTRLAAIEVGFTVDPADAKVTVWDSNKDIVAPADGKYTVMSGAEYTYLVQKDGYVSQKSSFQLDESSTVVVTLAEATENPNLDKSITAEWGNFRNGDNNLGITNAKTPYAPEDAEILWAVKHGTGWAAAPGSPIMVDGDIYTYSGSTIRRLNSMTGETVTEGTMVGSSSYSIVPMTYGDGMVFVGLSDGRIQAFNAKTLESLWVYTDELGGQPNCPITYKDGYIYAGFWNSEARNANFACINTIDEDHASATEVKYASWTYTRAGGFYWAGAYVTDKLAIVGTDDGAGGYDTNGAALLVFDRFTGEKLDTHEGIRGDIRSNVSHDPQSDRVFFTTKGGILGNAKIDWDTGKILDYKEAVISDANGNTYAMSTCTPSVYNGRIYIGVSGTSQFGANSGHAIAVYDLNGDGSMTKAYAYGIIGYPQTSAMVTTAYAGEDGYVYIYLPYNYTPGGISVLKDRPGQTAPLTTTNSGYSEVFTPAAPLAQYCICSTIADQYGTLYYKNDSCYMMAITSKIESLEITQYPTITENEDGTLTVDGLKAVTKLRNGEERDVSKYVSVTKNEQTGGYTVSYTYGFDSENYGLKTVTAEIADYTVTIPTGEGYTITGEKTAKGGKDYTFKLELDYRYEAGEDFAVQVNGETVTGEKGVYTVKNVSTDLVITVKGVKEKVLKPVTVYFSFSHDDTFESCNESGETMALKEVTVPYFDLELYGLENFYFASENYGPASGDPTGGPGSALDPGTKEFAYGKVTMFHLFIYATEVYYLGIDPADAGKGYLKDNGLGSSIFNVTGSTGSTFLQEIWNYDLNLNYYLNYEYPLAGPGWGSTSDQILLRDGDIVTLGHFSDWSFFNDTTSIFNYIVADKTDPVQGDKIKLELYHAGNGMGGDYTTAHTLIDYSPSVYCTPVNDIVSGDVTTWQNVGDAEADGSLVVDTSKLAPGEYIFALAGQPGKENPGAICSTPGGVRVTVHEKPVVKGDIDGDGKVNALDVSALYSGIFSGEELDAAVADINGDGKINVLDVSALYALVMNNG